jgi:hypothetical protein
MNTVNDMIHSGMYKLDLQLHYIYNEHVSRYANIPLGRLILDQVIPLHSTVRTMRHMDI